jgi:hypothetical protein
MTQYYKKLEAFVTRATDKYKPTKVGQLLPTPVGDIQAVHIATLPPYSGLDIFDIYLMFPTPEDKDPQMYVFEIQHANTFADVNGEVHKSARALYKKLGDHYYVTKTQARISSDANALRSLEHMFKSMWLCMNDCERVPTLQAFLKTCCDIKIEFDDFITTANYGNPSEGLLALIAEFEAEFEADASVLPIESSPFKKVYDITMKAFEDFTKTDEDMLAAIAAPWLCFAYSILESKKAKIVTSHILENTTVRTEDVTVIESNDGYKMVAALTERNDQLFAAQKESAAALQKVNDQRIAEQKEANKAHAAALEEANDQRIAEQKEANDQRIAEQKEANDQRKEANDQRIAALKESAAALQKVNDQRIAEQKEANEALVAALKESNDTHAARYDTLAKREYGRREHERREYERREPGVRKRNYTAGSSSAHFKRR